jgi:hypothetical protein
VSSYEIYFASMLRRSYEIYSRIYMNFEVRGKSIQTLVVKMLSFLHIFSFRDVTMVKRLM